MEKVRISEYYLPLLKNISEDVKIASHKYCLKAGLVKQCGSGIYAWLPLGLRVIQNIENIIRHELNASGLIEILMPCIQQAEIWKESCRYDGYGKEMLKFHDRHNHEMLFGPTNEELVTHLIKGGITSYKQLPKILYHIQWKFRDEIRPRFGLMRGREFLMKDAYSFDIDEENAKKSYYKMFAVYLSIFEKLGLNVIPCRADSGSIGGNLNHEFHLICDSGENKIFYDPRILELLNELSSNTKEESDIITELQQTYSVTDDIHNDKEKGAHCSNSIEVGHIFYFGAKYSSAMRAQILDASGKLKDLCMGSYGIGISRLVAAIIEANNDENGIIWPEAVTPFKVGLINLHEESRNIAEEIYKTYSESIIYDDTSDSAGVKFARMDLIGVPTQIIVGKNSIKNGTIELKNRKINNKKEIKISNLL